MKSASVMSLHSEYKQLCALQKLLKHYHSTSVTVSTVINAVQTVMHLLTYLQWQGMFGKIEVQNIPIS